VGEDSSGGIAYHKAYGTHSLRKSFARKVYKNCEHDINLTRAALGHREISTTQKYLDVDAGDVDAPVLRLGAVASSVRNSASGGAAR